MKLSDLNAAFLHPRTDGSGGVDRRPELAGAVGVIFRCPAGGHELFVWFERPVGAAPVSPDEPPRARWAHSGAGLHDLTLHPSVHERGHWHGWIRNGEVTTC